MKRLAQLAPMMLLLITLIPSALAQQASPNNGNQSAREDRIYSMREVDVRPRIKRKPNPEAGHDCIPDEGLVRLRVILHKTGKITNVQLIKGMSCGFDERAVEAAKKIEFEPAQKNGEPVSTAVLVEYNYRRY
jgi:TonB family protein